MVVDAIGAYIQIDTDIRITEIVARLHRIADDEKRSTIPGRPSANQPLNKLDLALRGILKFIDQDMRKFAVERKSKLCGAVIVGKCSDSGAACLSVIDHAAACEF